MRFSVLLTDDASRDLEDICDYIDLDDGRGKAGIMEDNVYVLLIADGRRDMQKLLQRRLLQA